MQIKSIAATLALGMASLTAAHATVLNFEDIGVFGDVSASGLTTHGFKLSDNTDAIDLMDSPWAATGPAHSGRYAALNDTRGDIVLTKTDGSLFSFQGLYVRSWFSSYEGGASTVTGYLNGAAIGSYAFTLGTTWQNVTGNLSGIDRLVVSAGPAFLLDDVSLDGADVPEPASLALLGLGMLAAGAARRRKQ